MTRDGLVEQNLATGEETRVTQRGQEFSLKWDAPGHTPGAASAREVLQSRPRQAAPAQNAEPSSPDMPASGADRPMEAARPGHREIGARAHETPAGGASSAKPGSKPEQERPGR
jgi:hypothetical protein